MVSHIFPRHTQDELPIASGGYGCFLFDETVKKYLDASGGAAVSCLGHSHPKIIKALHEQLDVLAYAHTSFFSSEPAEKLATKLLTNANLNVLWILNLVNIPMLEIFAVEDYFMA